jgi:alanyl-tRNA synthetase
MTSGMTSGDIRKLFVDYFRERGHEVVPSGPLVPKDDPTLLFTSAGMVPFKPYYTAEAPPMRRAVSVQRCLRLSDLDEVGRTPYHMTFFEMLGNFSFGDYFKREAVEWGWDFLTRVLELPSERLWATVYEDDDDAAELWRSMIGLPPERIVRLGDEDNFWGPAGDTGPCGPCSEIHYDMGAGRGCGRDDCNPGCDCDRFFEVWNLVFPQFLQKADTTRVPLKRPGIDTGMGFERVASVVQGVGSVYEIDLVAPLVRDACDEAERASGKRPPGDGVGIDVAVIVDHARAVTFTVGENINPSNESQGYVVRRLVRRAARRGRSLGIEEPFLYRLAGTVIDLMGDAHPHLRQKREHIALVVKSEEERFLDTLASGSQVFEGIAAELRSDGAAVIPGTEAFRLYDTYGFPIDLTEEMAKEQGLSVDIEGFAAAMEKQKERGRRASTFGDASGVERRWTGGIAEGPESHFVGYELAPEDAALAERSGVMCLAMPVAATVVRARPGRAEGELEFTLDRTPFYAEAGGQVADTGTVAGEGVEAQVVNVYVEDGHAVHVATMTAGEIRPGAALEVRVDMTRRRRIEKNHTATHLLQAALRLTLGDHVHQSGSWVGPDRLRFDFTHFSELSPETLEAIEEQVNAWIRADAIVCPELTDLESALERGAMALFGEKYGEQVRAVSVPGVSLELCGGTHTRSTGEIGSFSITAETGIAAGVRRIEAVTGADAHARAREHARQVRILAELLRCTRGELEERARTVLDDVSRLRKELTKERQRAARDTIGGLLESARDVDGIRVVSARTEAADVPDLRSQADRLREKLGSGAGVLGADIGGRSTLISVVTDDLSSSGRLSAGDLVREVAGSMGGRGGGNPHLAQGGGGDIELLDGALQKAYEIVARLVADRGGSS